MGIHTLACVNDYKSGFALFEQDSLVEVIGVFYKEILIWIIEPAPAFYWQ
jgi:hypothetical protein